MHDRGAQPVLPAELQDHARGHPLLEGVGAGQPMLRVPKRVADLVKVPLEQSGYLPRRAEVVRVLLEGFRAHGLREQQRRRRERQGAHTAVEHHVRFGLTCVRVGADRLLAHLPPAPAVEHPALLAHLVDHAVVRDLLSNHLLDPLVPLRAPQPQRQLLRAKPKLLHGDVRAVLIGALVRAGALYDHGHGHNVIPAKLRIVPAAQARVTVLPGRLVPLPRHALAAVAEPNELHVPLAHGGLLHEAAGGQLLSGPPFPVAALLRNRTIVAH